MNKNKNSGFTLTPNQVLVTSKRSNARKEGQRLRQLEKRKVAKK